MSGQGVEVQETQTDHQTGQRKRKTKKLLCPLCQKIFQLTRAQRDLYSDHLLSVHNINRQAILSKHVLAPCSISASPLSDAPAVVPAVRVTNCQSIQGGTTSPVRVNEAQLKGRAAPTSETGVKIKQEEDNCPGKESSYAEVTANDAQPDRIICDEALTSLGPLPAILQAPAQGATLTQPSIDKATGSSMGGSSVLNIQSSGLLETENCVNGTRATLQDTSSTDPGTVLNTDAFVTCKDVSAGLEDTSPLASLLPAPKNVTIKTEPEPFDIHQIYQIPQFNWPEEVKTELEDKATGPSLNSALSNERHVLPMRHLPGPVDSQTITDGLDRQATLSPVSTTKSASQSAVGERTTMFQLSGSSRSSVRPLQNMRTSNLECEVHQSTPPEIPLKPLLIPKNSILANKGNISLRYHGDQKLQTVKETEFLHLYKENELDSCSEHPLPGAVVNEKSLPEDQDETLNAFHIDLPGGRLVGVKAAEYLLFKELETLGFQNSDPTLSSSLTAGTVLPSSASTTNTSQVGLREQCNTDHRAPGFTGSREKSREPPIPPGDFENCHDDSLLENNLHEGVEYEERMPNPVFSLLSTGSAMANFVKSKENDKASTWKWGEVTTASALQTSTKFKESNTGRRNKRQNSISNEDYDIVMRSPLTESDYEDEDSEEKERKYRKIKDHREVEAMRTEYSPVVNQLNKTERREQNREYRRHAWGNRPSIPARKKDATSITKLQHMVFEDEDGDNVSGKGRPFGGNLPIALRCPTCCRFHMGNDCGPAPAPCIICGGDHWVKQCNAQAKQISMVYRPGISCKKCRLMHKNQCPLVGACSICLRVHDGLCLKPSGTCRYCGQVHWENGCPRWQALDEEMGFSAGQAEVKGYKMGMDMASRVMNYYGGGGKNDPGTSTQAKSGPKQVDTSKLSPEALEFLSFCEARDRAEAQKKFLPPTYQTAKGIKRMPASARKESLPPLTYDRKESVRGGASDRGEDYSKSSYRHSERQRSERDRDNESYTSSPQRAADKSGQSRLGGGKVGERSRDMSPMANVKGSLDYSRQNSHNRTGSPEGPGERKYDKYRPNSSSTEDFSGRRSTRKRENGNDRERTREVNEDQMAKRRRL